MLKRLCYNIIVCIHKNISIILLRHSVGKVFFCVETLCRKECYYVIIQLYNITFDCRLCSILLLLLCL